MSSAQSLFKSFLILVVCLVCSVAITNFVLMPLEMVQNTLRATGMQDAPPEWSNSGDIDFYVSIAYWLTYFLDFFGVGQFIWVAIRRQRYDIYGNQVEEED